MDSKIQNKEILEIIERMKLAKIGEYKKWEVLIKKILEKKPWNQGEVEYYTRITRIYNKTGIVVRSKNYHRKLSSEDIKPKCKECGNISEFYCNMNDQYYCLVHIVGHDENEF